MSKPRVALACCTVAVAAAVLGSCEPTHAASAVVKPANTTQAFTIKTVTTSMTFRDGKASLSPAPQSDQPTTSASAAHSAALNMWPDLATGGTADVSFGLWTDSSVGPVDSSGNIQPRFVNLPVWLVHFPAAPIYPQGGIGGIAPSVLSGDVYVLVQDSDGKVIGRFSVAMSR